MMRFAGKEYYLDKIRMRLYVNHQKKPVRFDRWTFGLGAIIGFFILVPHWGLFHSSSPLGPFHFCSLQNYLAWIRLVVGCYTDQTYDDHGARSKF